jgi:NADPH:quinone reductase-like Zn-dependent oxidoreductase
VRAAVHTRYGPPDVVEVREVPTPTPGDGELLVRVHTATVNRTDCHYRSATPFPMRAIGGWTRPRVTVLGNEFAGTVEALGHGAAAFAVGDRVFGYCEGRFGAHAEHLVVRADGHLAHVPKGVPLEGAAPATEGSHYALTHLRSCGVAPGTDVLVYGATGAIGSAAVPLAKHLGATVTAVCATPHLALVEGLGADRVVDYTTGDFTRDAQRYEVVFDAHGSVGYGAARRLLRPGGRFASAGAGPHLENLYAPLTSRLYGDTRCVFTSPTLDQATMALLAEMLGDGSFRPLVDRTYPLDDIVDAYRYAESGQKLGNVLVAIER